MAPRKSPKIKTGGVIQAGHLKSIVERAQNLDKEKDAILSDVRDLYKEATGVGYNAKIIRKIVAMKKRDAAEMAAEAAEMELYLAALNTAVEMVKGGASLRQAERATGASKSSIHRALTVPAPSHDPETGELAETADLDTRPLGSDEGTAENEAASALVAAEESTTQESGNGLDATAIRGPSVGDATHAGPGRSSEGGGQVGGLCAGRSHEREGASGTQGDEGSGRSQAEEITKSCGGVESRHAPMSEGSGADLEATKAGVAPGPQDPIDTTIPAFLRRVAA